MTFHYFKWHDQLGVYRDSRKFRRIVEKIYEKDLYKEAHPDTISYFNSLLKS